MAPESPRSNGLSANVYSFLILLRQIVTKRTQYRNIMSRTKVAAKMVKRHLRPNLAFREPESSRKIHENGGSADPGRGVYLLTCEKCSRTPFFVTSRRRRCPNRDNRVAGHGATQILVTKNHVTAIPRKFFASGSRRR